MYLPLACLAVLGVLGRGGLGRRLVLATRRRGPCGFAVRCLLGFVALWWGASTFLRNRLYSDPARMWANVIERAPTTPGRITTSRAASWQPTTLRGPPSCSPRAIEVDPTVHRGLLQSRKDHAARPGQRGRRDPRAAAGDGDGSAQRHGPLRHCRTLGKAGRLAVRPGNYEQASEIQPDYGPRTRYRLGRLWRLDGKTEEAIPHFLTALDAATR